MLDQLGILLQRLISLESWYVSACKLWNANCHKKVPCKGAIRQRPGALLPTQDVRYKMWFTASPKWEFRRPRATLAKAIRSGTLFLKEQDALRLAAPQTTANTADKCRGSTALAVCVLSILAAGR